MQAVNILEAVPEEKINSGKVHSSVRRELAALTSYQVLVRRERWRVEFLCCNLWQFSAPRHNLIWWPIKRSDEQQIPKKYEAPRSTESSTPDPQFFEPRLIRASALCITELY